MSRSGSSAACLAAVFLLAACHWVAGYEEFGSEIDRVQCGPLREGLPGPAMKRVDLGANRCFWMDQTEVTVEQYEKFLAARPPLQDTPECAANSSYEPDYPGCEEGESCIWTHPARPIAAVDWCDAF